MMKQYHVIFRGGDPRDFDPLDPAMIDWLEMLRRSVEAVDFEVFGRIVGSLAMLEGCALSELDAQGTDINAAVRFRAERDDEALQVCLLCPALAFGGTAEIREVLRAP